MDRITDKHLEALVLQLNKLTNSPITSYSVHNGRHVANIGNYHLSHAYGGVCLHRMHTEGGGVSTPLLSYHSPKRELYSALHAFIDGIETGMSLQARADSIAA